MNGLKILESNETVTPIKQLAEQAGLYVDLNGQLWPRAMSAEESETAYKKFAELIVKECAGICDDYGMPDGTSQIAMILSYAIKRKFGIEDVDTQLRNRSTYFGNNP